MGSIVMSVVCEKCHARHPIETGRFRYVYAFDDGKQLPISTLLGYCQDCNGYKYIEDISFDIDDVVDELTTVLSALASIREERGLVSTRLVIGDDNTLKPLDITHISHIANDLDQIVLHHRFHAMRTSPPRGLECGGLNDDIVESRSPSARPFDKPVLTHPGCGGAMHYEQKGHIMFKHLPPIRRYSVEGLFIDSFDPEEKA